MDNDTLSKHSGIRLDIGCGEHKQPGWFGMDIRELEGVDLVHDICDFPWPLQDGTVITAMASHLVEHIPPFYTDPRLLKLIKILKSKHILNDGDLDFIGGLESYPTFI